MQLSNLNNDPTPLFRCLDNYGEAGPIIKPHLQRIGVIE